MNGNQGLTGSKMKSTTAVDHLTCNAQVKTDYRCGAFHLQVFWGQMIALCEEHSETEVIKYLSILDINLINGTKYAMIYDYTADILIST